MPDVIDLNPQRVPLKLRLKALWTGGPGYVLFGIVLYTPIAVFFGSAAPPPGTYVIAAFGAILALMLAFSVWFVWNHKPLTYTLHRIGTRVILDPRAFDAYIVPEVLEDAIEAYYTRWDDAYERVLDGTLDDPDGYLRNFHAAHHEDTEPLYPVSIRFTADPIPAERPDNPEQTAYGLTRPRLGRILIWKKYGADTSVLHYELANLISYNSRMLGGELEWIEARRRLGID